jgi:Domain of unknown function (DUF4386)
MEDRGIAPQGDAPRHSGPSVAFRHERVIHAFLHGRAANVVDDVRDARWDMAWMNDTESEGRAPHARLAGLLYLIPMFLGPFSMMYVPRAIVVPGDAAATAVHLVASQTLFRMGMLSDAVIVLSELALTAVLYTLLRPAGRTLALTATFARLGMTVLQAANLIPQLAALELVTGGGEHLGALDVAAREALALFALVVHDGGVRVWEILFALHCALVGVLVFRSRLFPKALGVMMGLAAIGYALEGVGHLVAPGMASVFASIVGLTALVGEVPFVLWLLFRGVDARRWREADAAAPA